MTERVVAWKDLEELAARIGEARALTILTGAGVSAASGVPTFRGAAGLWRQFRPEELATPAAFARDPVLVWEWYAWRRAMVAGCAPNAAHEVIARWSARSEHCRVVTQNVDDLHIRAGTSRLVRLHGSLWELSCAGAIAVDRHVTGARNAPTGAVRGISSGCPNGLRPWRDEQVPLPALPPRCPHCGGLARPAVVWFGESLAAEDMSAALDATACDAFVTVGTSALVYPAAGLIHEARRRGAFTAEINMEATPASSEVDVAIQGAAERILPVIDRLVSRRGASRSARTTS